MTSNDLMPKLFLCPGLVFKIKDTWVVITYVWSGSCDCRDLVTGSCHVRSHSQLRDATKATLVATNYKGKRDDSY